MFFKDFVSVKRQKIKRGASQTYDTPSFKKHKKSPARNRVGDVCVIKLTLCQLQRADALSYFLNGTIENAFLLCIERVNMTTNL